MVTYNTVLTRFDWAMVFGTHVFRKLTLPLHSKDGAVTDGRDITMQPRIIGPMWRL